jgi:hypothetical protein
MVMTAGIVGLVATIIVSAVIHARDKSATTVCISNLQQIARAKAIWAFEHRATGTETPLMEELFGTDNYLKIEPVCPMNGNYSVNSVSENPTCDKPGHELP